MDELFLKHPREAGETYGEHAAFAVGSGLTLIAAGLACIVHGLIPAAFETTGSRTVGRLNRVFAERAERCRH